ncbi:MAG TPA: hypothetical protein VJJ81_01315 [Candidatus Babeliales bacterium]|nr:hypothetical protein [Candidatus Babeliales bacterium]
MAEKFKKLIKHDNELALVIDKAVLKKLNIDDNTKLEISLENNGIFITIAGAIKTISNKDLERSGKKIMDKYAPVFEKLAKI